MNWKRLRTPDLSQGAGPAAVVEAALVVPPPPAAPRHATMPAGILRPDGRFVHESVTWQHRTALNRRPPRPDGDLARLPGIWMFMGPLIPHFGHFIVESIARLGALDLLDRQIDGLVFIPRHNTRSGQALARYEPVLRLLGVRHRVLNLAKPTQVETLLIPPQGLGLGPMIAGSPELRRFVRAQAGRTIAARGAPRIYISRSRLGPDYQSILGEEVLEGLLRAEGYDIYHPQEHPIEDQIAAYKAATHVIALDGSPLHLLALVGHAGQKVAVIARREGHRDLDFVTQIRSFLGAEAQDHYHLRRQWQVSVSRDGNPRTWGEADFPALCASLREAGMISARSSWPELPASLIERQIRQIETIKGVSLRPGPRAARSGQAVRRPSPHVLRLERIVHRLSGLLRG
ncbi:capsular polysaccharide biosynthesis protein [Rubellimicrobium aerolatum]|nr:capsular polysaccharide biosynthesis protein [Rubellimicrobium aerolatum]